MKILVTGAAGFIGYHVAKKLAVLGHEIIGLDNINDYYDISLKLDRLKDLGIPESEALKYNQLIDSSVFQKSFRFIRINLEDKIALSDLFKSESFEVVCNMAAQAGVRYSLENPDTYVNSNIVGFFNILECCRHNKIKHLVYASSSSVYGLNQKIPFETTDKVDSPISLYAASKKSNELMAYTYSHLFGFATTGLRFFTVYGPWGRPDMAMFIFTKAILKGEPIKVFNDGKMQRDFTYIDDIVEGVIKIIQTPVKNRITNNALYKIYNIGNNKSVKLLDFIEAIEKTLGIKSEKILLPIQPGDVEKTWANVDALIKDYDYNPNTDYTKGVKKFIEWYRKYYDL